MSNLKYIKKTKKPNTITSIHKDLKNLGIEQGDTVLVHCSLSSIGYTVGNAVSVIEALIRAVGPEGNIIMPTFSGENSDPAHWVNPPVPKPWWDVIRKNSPGFDPLKTPSLMMGSVAETFRTYPGVVRSNHPQCSFTAYGPQAEFITKDHQLTPAFGSGSPMEKNVELNGKILLIGVGHSNNSTLHYVDWSANYPNKKSTTQGAAILKNGKAEWVEFPDLEYEDEDFEEVGKAYEISQPIVIGTIGIGNVKVFPAKNFVQFAKTWFETHR